MKKNKKIKIIAWSVLGLFLVFNVFMVWHILDRTKKANAIDSANIQLSAINFDKPFDSIGTVEIKSKLGSIPGVKSRITVVKNVVVYHHDNRVTNSKKVFAELMTKGNYNAKSYEVPTNLVGKEVCPMMKKEGFYYNYTQLVLRIFN